jgi:hypothetical protein
MTNKNMPDTGADKNTTGTNPTDRRTNETPDGVNTVNRPAKEGERRGTEGTHMDRGSTSTVPNPGRDITTGGPGADGTNRNWPNDNPTTPSAMDGDAAEDHAERADKKVAQHNA